MPVVPLDIPEIKTSDTPPKRGPGRPKGSKNKPKDPVDQVAKEYEGNGDKPPNKGRRKKRISSKVTEQIEEALAEVLCAPAMGTAIIGDEWATQHFVTTGKELAHRIAVVSERHSQLRAWCERALEGETVMVLVLGFAAYLIPPLIHWNIIPGPDGMLGVPKRARQKRANPEGSPTQATEWSEGQTAQQQYEQEVKERGESNGHAEPVYAQFHGDDEGAEPPTFIETPG